MMAANVHRHARKPIFIQQDQAGVLDEIGVTVDLQMGAYTLLVVNNNGFVFGNYPFIFETPYFNGEQRVVSLFFPLDESDVIVAHNHAIN